MGKFESKLGGGNAKIWKWSGWGRGEGVSSSVCIYLSEVAQSSATLCNPMDRSLPGSSVRGISQARVLEWVAISFSRGSSRPGNRTQVSRIAGGRFTL